MPKECTHWIMANRLIDRIPPSNPVASLLAEHRSFVLVGAILPDTLLHAVIGPNHGNAHAAASRFHSPGRHSYQTLQAILESTSPTPQELALLIGIATHIETDIVFHPCIEMLAGGSISEHYRLETLLDQWICQAYRQKPASLSSLLNQQILNTVAALLPLLQPSTPAVTKQQAKIYLQLHALIQKSYDHPLGRGMAAVLSRCMPALHRYKNLWYPSETPQHWPWPANCAGCSEVTCLLPATCILQVEKRLDRLMTAIQEKGIKEAFIDQPGEDLITGQRPQ